MDGLRQQLESKTAAVTALESTVEDLKIRLHGYKQDLELVRSDLARMSARLEKREEEVDRLQGKSSCSAIFFSFFKHFELC